MPRGRRAVEDTNRGGGSPLCTKVWRFSGPSFSAMAGSRREHVLSPPDVSRRFRTLARVTLLRYGWPSKTTVAATGDRSGEFCGRVGSGRPALVLGKRTVLQKCCDGNNDTLCGTSAGWYDDTFF